MYTDLDEIESMYRLGEIRQATYEKLKAELLNFDNVQLSEIKNYD